MDREAVLKFLEELKAEMKEVLGDRLVGLLLFGTYSRGDYSASSEVDLVILADGGAEQSGEGLVLSLLSPLSLMSPLSRRYLTSSRFSVEGDKSDLLTEET